MVTANFIEYSIDINNANEGLPVVYNLGNDLPKSGILIFVALL